MKSKILLLALTAAVLSSCTTAYQTGQTPDDVYYSPARPQEEYVQTDRNDDRENRNYRRNDDSYYEDQYLRMKVRNRYRWSDLDDPYYYSRRYSFTTYNCCCFSNPWTPFSYWNNHYNPYYNNYVIVNPKTVAYSSPRTFNLNTYNSNALTNSNYSNPKVRNNSGNHYINNNGNNTYSAPRNRYRDNNESNSGRILRDVFNGNNSSGSSSNNNSSSSSGNNNSSSSSSSGSSSSSSSSSGSSAPVRKF